MSWQLCNLFWRGAGFCGTQQDAALPAGAQDCTLPLHCKFQNGKILVPEQLW